MDKKKIVDALTKALEDKGKRKFSQSVEFIMNFRGVDFTKPEHRLNIDIALPKGKGKELRIIVFADGQLAVDAKNAGLEVVGGAQIPSMAANKKDLKKLAKQSEFLSQPNLMTVVGKNLGQVLGTMGKLPKPVAGLGVPVITEAAKQARTRVRMASKGKYLPVAQCLVGTEAMNIEDLAENIDAVYEKVKAKVTEPNIKSAFVKLTMGKPVKI
jgi:large subunit ribosomal protein L1